MRRWGQGREHAAARRAAPWMLICWLVTGPAAAGLANPLGPTIIQGVDDISGVGTPEVTIYQTAPQAVVNWQAFDIAAGEITRFVQPSPSAWALNRIFDTNPSRIMGSLQANGSVVLINPNGVWFGPGAQVNVAGLVASSLNLSDERFLAGVYRFEGSALGGVHNAGRITTPSGGFVYLFAPAVSNSGVITSPDGHVALASGSTVYLGGRPDGGGLLVQVSAPAGEAVNLGELVADGGRVDLYAGVVNQSGVVRADTVRETNGRIELVAGERLVIGSASRTEARGADEGISAGGVVVARSDTVHGETRFEEGAVIDVSGGREGGDAGFVELSGGRFDLSGAIRGAALTGFRGARILLDPYDYRIDQAEFARLLRLSAGASELEIAAEHDLSVEDVDAEYGVDPGTGDELWGLLKDSGLTLRFRAGHDLRLIDSLLGHRFDEGESFNPYHLEAVAGNDLVVRGSSLITMGGDIELSAIAGDIRLEFPSGGDHTYLWAKSGGDIRLSAGRDVVAPSALDETFGWYSGVRLDAGSEARPGDLTINAGGDFLGGEVNGVAVGPGFVLSNGRADISLVGRFGAPGSYANLTVGTAQVSIISGGDAYLGLVQDKGVVEAAVAGADPDNRLDIVAGGDLHLNPSVALRTTSDELRRYYPASFHAAATQGSVWVESHVGFWPSRTGSISFAARDHILGANLNGVATQVRLLASDPAAWRGHAISPELLTLITAPAESAEDHPAAPVSFRTELGNIRTINFDLYSPALRKDVAIEAGGDLAEIVAHISAPGGSRAVVSAGGDLDMTRPAETAAESGIHFYGTGEGAVRVGGLLNLANSQGLSHRLSRIPSNDVGLPGRLDLAVGGNLEMTQSRIVTYNGGSIAIHGLDGPDSPVDGFVNVGTNEQADRGFGTVLGIATLRGGGIDITASGNVEVNLSRVATFGGGDIAMTSGGNINAGSGGRDERVEFVVEQRDADGNLVFDPRTGQPVRTVAYVPGSGIFTFHPDDPDPLPDFPPPPPFEFVPPSRPPESPEIAHLEAEVFKHRFLGHDTATLETELAGLREAWDREYETVVRAAFETAVDAAREEYAAIKAAHIAPWKLGNISLEAAENVVVPPAGIRGRAVKIKARNLVLEGGQIAGNVEFDIDKIIGRVEDVLGGYTGTVGGAVVVPPTAPAAPPVVTAPSGGGVGLGGLSGATGSLSTTSVSAATIVAETVSPSQSPAGGAAESAAESEPGQDKKDKKTRSVRLKRGVTIEVAVSPESSH